MAFKPYKGWYSLTNPDKFLPPKDNYMQSFNESSMSVEYKSSLEAKSFMYCDKNDKIVKWSVEPFPIMYKKPTTGKMHRYFIDLFIEFESGAKFLVEVKSSSETKEPSKPKKMDSNSIRRYKRAMITWAINSAKWTAAQKFCEENDFKFIFLTEKQLNG